MGFGRDFKVYDKEPKKNIEENLKDSYKIINS